MAPSPIEVSRSETLFKSWSESTMVDTEPKVGVIGIFLDEGYVSRLRFLTASNQ
jgi:hypothetical protein